MIALHALATAASLTIGAAAIAIMAREIRIHGHKGLAALRREGPR